MSLKANHESSNFLQFSCHSVIFKKKLPLNYQLIRGLLQVKLVKDMEVVLLYLTLRSSKLKNVDWN